MGRDWGKLGRKNLFESLAHLAKREDWNFKDLNSCTNMQTNPFPILTNYLNTTFLRLQDESKIVYSKRRIRLLLTRDYRHHETKYFCYISSKINLRKTEINQIGLFIRFVILILTNLNHSGPLPELANYITNVEELVFNTEYQIEPNLDHFLENNESRLPEAFQKYDWQRMQLMVRFYL